MWLPAGPAAKALGYRSTRTLREHGAEGKVVRRPRTDKPSEYEYLVEVGAGGGGEPDPAPATIPAGDYYVKDDGTDDLLALLGKAPAPEPPQAPAPAQARARVVAGIFDVHVPEHDGPTMRAFLAWCRDHKPDEIVIGGDFVELESCSQHGGVANPASLVEEAKAARGVLREIRDTNPDALIRYLEGNHESRLDRIVVNRIPTLDGALTISSLLDLPGFGIEYIKTHIDLGKLRVLHGSYTNLHHAAKHLNVYGTSVAYGHTHRPQMHTRATATSRLQGAFGMPCMRSLDPSWLHGVPQGWAHGFGIFEIHPDGLFTAYTVLAVDGRFSWGGKIYDGRAP